MSKQALLRQLERWAKVMVQGGLWETGGVVIAGGPVIAIAPSAMALTST